jgi:hypothetical protein
LDKLDHLSDDSLEERHPPETWGNTLRFDVKWCTFTSLSKAEADLVWTLAGFYKRHGGASWALRRHGAPRKILSASRCSESAGIDRRWQQDQLSLMSRLALFISYAYEWNPSGDHTDVDPDYVGLEYHTIKIVI